MSPIVWWIIAALLIALGVVGAFVPAVPGVLFVLGGMFLAAWIDGFRRSGWITLGTLGLLAVFALALDVVAGLLGAKRVGASRLALVGAAIGSVVGILFGFLGALIGPFVGAAAGEWISRGGIAQAARVGLGTWIGVAVSLVARVVVVFAMLAVFVASYLL
jgi:uncharacterized protein YqgC (DUF456 family)